MLHHMHNTVSRCSTVTPQSFHPRSHLNQETQCGTKDSGFYLYFFICYSGDTDTVTAAGVETAVRVRWGERKIKNKAVLLLFSFFMPNHRLSPSLSLFTRLLKSCFPLITVTFPFVPVFKE